jgi:DDE domain
VAIDELVTAVFHNTDQYGNNRVERHHGRLKARLRPMRGFKRDHTARVIMHGHALCRTSDAPTTNGRLPALPCSVYLNFFWFWNTPYIAETSATATNPTTRPMKMMIAGSASDVSFLSL